MIGGHGDSGSVVLPQAADVAAGMLAPSALALASAALASYSLVAAAMTSVAHLEIFAAGVIDARGTCPAAVILVFAAAVVAWMRL